MGKETGRQLPSTSGLALCRATTLFYAEITFGPLVLNVFINTSTWKLLVLN